MNKKIEFEKDGQKYILEYNRESIEILEKQGFVIGEMIKKPMVMLPLAFEGLFYKNHKNVKKSFVENCFNQFKNKSKLIEVISEMLSETYESLTDDEGNMDWKIV